MQENRNNFSNTYIKTDNSSSSLFPLLFILFGNYFRFLNPEIYQPFLKSAKPPISKKYRKAHKSNIIFRYDICFRKESMHI